MINDSKWFFWGRKNNWIFDVLLFGCADILMCLCADSYQEICWFHQCGNYQIIPWIWNNTSIEFKTWKNQEPDTLVRTGFFLWPWRDSNPQPTVPETVILSSWTTEPIRVAKIEKNLLHLQLKITVDFITVINKITSLSAAFQMQTTHRANGQLP